MRSQESVQISSSHRLKLTKPNFFVAWSKVLLTVQSDTDLTLIVGPICTAVELQNNEEKKKKKRMRDHSVIF